MKDCAAGIAKINSSHAVGHARALLMRSMSSSCVHVFVGWAKREDAEVGFLCNLTSRMPVDCHHRLLLDTRQSCFYWHPIRSSANSSGSVPSSTSGPPFLQIFRSGSCKHIKISCLIGKNRTEARQVRYRGLANTTFAASEEHDLGPTHASLRSSASSMIS